MESRFTAAAELRAGGDEEPKISGYAAVFNSRSLDLGGFREVILPGAFSKTITERDQHAFWQHDSSRPLGRRSAGTLALQEDEAGLRAEIVPPSTSWGHDALKSIQRGDVTQMSFGFRVVKDRFFTADDDVEVRELVEVELFEVSPVSQPAYEDTVAQVRDLIGVLTDREERHTEVIEALQRNLPGHEQPPDQEGEGDRIYRLPLRLRRQAMLERQIGA